MVLTIEFLSTGPKAIIIKNDQYPITFLTDQFFCNVNALGSLYVQYCRLDTPLFNRKVSCSQPGRISLVSSVIEFSPLGEQQLKLASYKKVVKCG